MSSGAGMGHIDLSRIKTIDGLDVKGKRVLVRADLNVPIENGNVADATRIERLLPTIDTLREGGAKLVIISHLGRPKGERTPETSLKPVAAKLQEMLGGARVLFLDDCVGPEVEAAVNALQEGDVALLENLRYHTGETANDPGFARQLANLGDIYVNDAFSCAHRAHASVEAITRLLPTYAGKSMMAEIDALASALEDPKRPVMAIVGGAKVSTKIDVLTHLVRRMNVVVVGGGMANTFLYAQGVRIGNSLCEPDLKDTALDVMAMAKESGCEIMLPIDEVVAKELAPGTEVDFCDIDAIPPDEMILDVGPKSLARVKEKLGEMATLLWNGPLGAFEVPPFGEGTFTLAREAAHLSKAGELISIAGGGDTVRALNMAGVVQDFTYISTAGGAFLEWLAGEQLPGVVALVGQGAARSVA